MKINVSIVACIIASLLPAYSTAKVANIVDYAQFKKAMKANKKTTLMQISSEACGVCKKIKQQLEELSNEPEFQEIQFVRVDIDQHPQITKEYPVFGVPMFIVIKDGLKKDEMVGIKNMETFKDMIRNSVRRCLVDASSVVSHPEPILLTPKTALLQHTAPTGFMPRLTNGIQRMFASTKQGIVTAAGKIRGLFNHS